MSDTKTLAVLTVIAEGDGGQRLNANLEQGKNLFVGASNHCGLQLCGDDISSLQCLFTLDGDVVSVQDWASKSGTFVNGEPISTKVDLGDGDEVRIATYRIRVACGTKDADRASSVPNAAFDRSGIDHTETNHSSDEAVVQTPSSAPSDDETSPRESDDRGFQLNTDGRHDPSLEQAEAASASEVGESFGETSDDATLETFGEASDESLIEVTHETSSESQEETLPEASCIPFDDRETSDHAGDSFRFDADLFEADSFDQETMQLLRAEIEDLQAALAQRDEQIASLVSDRESGGGDPDQRDELEHQTETMLRRLQDLLDEAECHDERVAVLEELLQTAEEANQAEQEERAQLEAWVGDIERRIGQREDEWKAEAEALRGQVDQARGERDRVQHQLRDAASQGSAPAAYQETLDRLQQQNQTLQQELDTRGKEVASLQQRLERAENREEETLRDERAAVARERAEVSRLRHELQQQLTESEALPRAKDQPDREFANRLKTLREHLKEIHEEEKQEREQRGGSALASRIGRLWKRLEY